MTPRYKGRYFDGRRALERPVEVSLSADAVSFTGTGGDVHEVWPTNRLWTPNKRLRLGAPVVLASFDAGEARLHVDDPDFAAALLVLLPRLGRSLFAGPERARQVVLVFALLLACGIGIFSAFHFGAAPMARLIPPNWVAPLGNQAYGMLVGKATVCRNAAADAAITRLAARLTLGLKRQPEIEILLSKRKMVNAFALPGGRIVFMRGIVDKMDSDVEFAAVLAHEIAHISERHPTVSVLRSFGIEVIFSVFLGASSESLGTAGDIAKLLAMLSYSRDAESSADRAALKMLAQADIDPRGLAILFEKISPTAKKKKKKKNKLTKDNLDLFSYLQSHPGSDVRIAMANKAYEETGNDNAAMTETEWEAVKSACNGGA